MKWIEQNWRKHVTVLPEPNPPAQPNRSVARTVLNFLWAPWRAPRVDFPPKILVEANFEIVFLTPAPVAEAELARFAERVGSRVGTLFKITKASILSSIAKGIGGDEIVAALTKHASAAVPQNVIREIEGWAGQCRRVGVRPALLIECPDQETCALVQSIGGKQVRPLTDITLEILDPKTKGPLLRKLRKDGIFG